MISLKLLYNVSLEDRYKDLKMCAMSIFNDMILLLFDDSNSPLHIYNWNGSYQSNIIILSAYGRPFYVAWTPHGNIIYITYPGYLVVISKSGDLVTTNNLLANPSRLSVSEEKVIYLACGSDVYQSSDDGITWKKVFRLSDLWSCYQLIVVKTEHGNDFLVMQGSGPNDYDLRLYSVIGQYPNANVTWFAIGNTFSKSITPQFSDCSNLAFDGNIFFTIDKEDNDVYIMFKNYSQWQFLSPSLVTNDVYFLTVYIARRLLYAAQTEGVMTVFEIED